MKADRIFRALGLIDSDLIAEAVPGGNTAVRRKPSWQAVTAVAACLVLVCSIGGWIATDEFRFGSHFDGSSSGSSAGPGEPSGNSGGFGLEEPAENGNTVFMSYAGPIFPLTTVEPSDGFTVERDIVWDFSPGAYDDGEPRQWGATVTDTYTILNPSDQDITVNALYPFAGQFSELADKLPTVTLDGAETNVELLAGPYSGSFQSTIGAEGTDTMNLDSLNSWTEYKALLASGEYLSQALSDAPVLDIPVTVYDFSDYEAPHETYRAATQAISFTIDETATQIFTYGFNGLEWGDNGFRRYSYFVPDGMRREPEKKMLIVLGDDIEDYILQGYQDGGCEDGEEIDGVSCTITHTETTFDAVLDQLCQAYKEYYVKGIPVDQANPFDIIPFTMYRRAAAELMVQYGPLGSIAADRYQDGRLDDILSEALSHDRVLYLKIPVTIPTGGSVKVAFQFWKAPSFDFHCGSDNEGLQGYDLVTQLGSSLNFTSQTASLENAESIIIVRQNFGFDAENSVTKVTLNPEQEHYYLEIQEKRT